jgi:tRNA dimethylallyltransferase
VPEQDRLWTEEARHPTLIFGLEVPPDVLARRIEARADAMFEAGVEDEVRAALAAGAVSATARYAHGLEEIASLPRAEARELMILRGRRYAAYQRKWMRRIPGLVAVSAERAPEDIAEEVIDAARARGMLAA